MALNFIINPINPKPISFLAPKSKNSCNFCNYSSSSSTPVLAATAEGKEADITEEGPIKTFDLLMGSSSSRTQLDLLDQLTGYESDDKSRGLTIRDQLAMLVGDRDEDFSIPLGKNLKKFSPKFLTVSQKRNIKRQSYLNQVSKRNDGVFFATIGAFVILPPLIILGVSIATGYVQLFP